jgi:hypothetical protein
MSSLGLNVPSPDEHNPGDVLAIIDSRIAAEADAKAHPLYAMVCWHLEKCLTPMDGGQFFDTFRSLVISAINTALDDALEALED